MSWWERFYDELGADVDRVFATQQADTAAEADFAVHMLGLRPPARILDLGCGTGRHSIELARRGFHVVGIDRSPAQLAAARAHAEAAGVRVQWRRADLRELPELPELPAADAAVCLFNSWGYFPDDEDNRRVLRQARAHLRPGGRLLLDTLNADWWVRHAGKNRGFVNGGAGISEELAYDAERRLLHARWRVHLDGRRVGTFVIHQHLYRLPEIRGRLHAAEFRIEGVYGDFGGGRMRPWSARSIWIARAAAGAESAGWPSGGGRDRAG